MNKGLRHNLMNKGLRLRKLRNGIDDLMNKGLRLNCILKQKFLGLL